MSMLKGHAESMARIVAQFANPDTRDFVERRCYEALIQTAKLTADELRGEQQEELGFKGGDIHRKICAEICSDCGNEIRRRASNYYHQELLERERSFFDGITN